MRLRDPYYLLILLIWIPMIWLYIRREIKDRPSVRFSDLSILKNLKSTFWARARHSVFILRLIGIGLLAVALARPQKGHTIQEVITHGVDIVLALDMSTSMKGLDFKPKNRLYVAKETIKEFIMKREHDRIGLVVFAGRSYTKCPLTLDYDILTEFIDDVDFAEPDYDGTAIGTAIATAANRLKESDAMSKIIILLTDGANNRGEISPQAAAQAASFLDIKIYTVGVGREGDVPYPVEYIDRFTGKKTVRTVNRPSEVDEQTLVNIADMTKGKFFRAHSAKKLKAIYEEIDKLEKSEIKTKTYTTFTEKFFVWLIAGFIVLFLEILLRNSKFRRIP